MQSTRRTSSDFRMGFDRSAVSTMPLDALTVGILRKKVNWVLDADIRGYYDTIDHGWLREVPRASDSGQEGPATHPEVVESRGDGEWTMGAE